MLRMAITAAAVVVVGTVSPATSMSPAATPQTSQPRQHQAGPPASYRLADVEIEMRRQGCYGTCPVYRVGLRGDGSGWYEGVKYVKITGRRSFNISPDSVVAVLQGFYDAGFFGFTQGVLWSTQKVDVDPSGNVLVRPTETVMVDVEDVWISIKIGSYQKEVSANGICLVGSGAWALGRLIDRATPALKWAQLR